MASKKASSFAVLLCLCASIVLPLTAHAGLLHKIGKTVKKTAEVVEKPANKVGETVHDSGITIGKEVKKDAGTATHELVDNGKVVGHVVVKDGKIIASETVEAGKVVSTETETGAKLIVKDGKIVGREVVVDGKVVGEEVIKDGKIVGHTVVAGGEYIVKEGELVYDAIRNCKKLGSMVPAPNLGAKDASVGAQCTGQASVGFMCKVPHLLDDFAKIPSLLSQIENDSKSANCKKTLVPPLPQVCGVVMLLADDAGKVFACLAAAERAGIIKQLLPKGNDHAFPSEQACMADGELAFDVAKQIYLSKIADKVSEAKKLAKASGEEMTTAMKVANRLLTTYKAAGMAATAADIAEKLKVIPACAK